MEEKKETLWKVVKGYFNALPDKESEKDTIKQIRNDVIFHGSNLWVLIFSILVASLGLNVNSTAVIIGAMLISPLMGPIIGIGAGVGITDFELVKQSFKNFAISTAISVLTAALYFSLSPITEAQSELLARTSPTLYDVLIAICGGAAGIIALCTKGKGNVIPGVAIATALMPPLCTAGYGIAIGNFSYFIGAFYLYFINSVFICAATFLGIRMLRFRHKEFVDSKRLRNVRMYIVVIVLLTMVPAAYMTIGIVRHSIAESNVARFVRAELASKGTQIISHDLDEERQMLDIVAVGRNISPKTIDVASKRMEQYHLSHYKLNVIQGSLSDSTLMSKLLHSATVGSDASNKKLMEQSAEMDELQKMADRYTYYENMPVELKGEINTLWPSIRTLSLSLAVENSMDSASAHPYVVAIAGCKKNLSFTEIARLQKWLKARVRADSVRLFVTQQ